MAKMNESEFRFGLYYTWFIRDEKGDIYCKRMLPHPIALKWENDQWIEVPYVEEKGESEKQLTTEEAYALFAENPPHPILEEVSQRVNAERDEKLLELAMTTPRRVIGWAYRPYGGRLAPYQGEDDESYCAFLRDVLEHGYSMTGERYQNEELEPVLDDYTWGDFSRRGFGRLMALAAGEHGDFDYAGHMEDLGDEDVVIPTEGLYPEMKHASLKLPVSKETYGEIFSLPKNDDFSAVIYLLPIPLPNGEYYFPDDRITLLDQEGVRSSVFRLHSILRCRKDQTVESVAEDAREKFEENQYYFQEPNFDIENGYLLLGLLVSGEPF